jgi:hypothetical protein
MSEENFELAKQGIVRTALRPLSERASQRRSLDEHLRVRFPPIFRVFSNAFLRLPPRSRLRRSMLPRFMGRAYAAANRRYFDLVLTANDPGIDEYRPSVDLLPPDLETVFDGHDGYLQLWRYWLDASRYFSSSSSDGAW